MMARCTSRICGAVLAGVMSVSVQADFLRRFHYSSPSCDNEPFVTYNTYVTSSRDGCVNQYNGHSLRISCVSDVSYTFAFFDGSSCDAGSYTGSSSAIAVDPLSCVAGSSAFGPAYVTQRCVGGVYADMSELKQPGTFLAHRLYYPTAGCASANPLIENIAKQCGGPVSQPNGYQFVVGGNASSVWFGASVVGQCPTLDTSSALTYVQTQCAPAGDFVESLSVVSGPPTTPTSTPSRTGTATPSTTKTASVTATPSNTPFTVQYAEADLSLTAVSVSNVQNATVEATILEALITLMGLANTGTHVAIAATTVLPGAVSGVVIHLHLYPPPSQPNITQLLVALRSAQAALNATVPPATAQTFTNTVANAVGQPSTSVSGSLSELQVALQRVIDNPSDPVAWLNFLWVLAGFLPLTLIVRKLRASRLRQLEKQQFGAIVDIIELLRLDIPPGTMLDERGAAFRKLIARVRQALWDMHRIDLPIHIPGGKTAAFVKAFVGTLQCARSCDGRPILFNRSLIPCWSLYTINYDNIGDPTIAQIAASIAPHLLSVQDNTGIGMVPNMGFLHTQPSPLIASYR